MTRLPDPVVIGDMLSAYGADTATLDELVQLAREARRKAWWDEFKTGKDLFLMVMKRGGDPVAIVPLYRRTDTGRNVLRFVGGIDLTDYCGPICSLEDRDEVAEALVGWLRSTETDWDEFDAHNMPVPLGFTEYLVERADAADPATSGQAGNAFADLHLDLRPLRLLVFQGSGNASCVHAHSPAVPTVWPHSSTRTR